MLWQEVWAVVWGVPRGVPSSRHCPLPHPRAPGLPGECQGLGTAGQAALEWFWLQLEGTEVLLSGCWHCHCVTV